MLAYIETITEILKHDNADALELAKIRNWIAVVKKGDFTVNQKIIFIEPDTVLPDKEWSKIYKAKSNRVKTIKLRGVFSQGIVEKLEAHGLPSELAVGTDVAETLGIVKYEAPMPQDLQAKGPLPFNLPVTDETNYQSLKEIPYGEKVDVTLKMDGKSWTAYAIEKDGEWHTGICSRRLNYKLDALNDYTRFQDILPKLLAYAQEHHISIAIRGEITGTGIQAFKNNPHAKGEKQLHLFSVYLPEMNDYAHKGDLFYVDKVASELGLPLVEKVESDVELTEELIKNYSEKLTQLHGQPFEGVVVQGKNFSFKIVNKDYDSKK